MKLAFCGFRHSHALSIYNLAQKTKGVEIIAAAEPTASARVLAEQNGIKITHSSYEELFATEADAVALGACYGERGMLAIAALKAGKHIFADKPLCTSLAELSEIKRISKEKNLKIGMMLDLRHMPQVVAAKKAIDRGDIGNIHCVSFGGQHPLSYGKRPMWYFEENMHGGTVNDISIHGIDLVRYLTGCELESVVAVREWNAFATAQPHFCDCAQLMAVLDGGVGLVADVSYSSPTDIHFSLTQSWRFTFWGSGGVLEFNCLDKRVSLAQNGGKELIYLDGGEETGDCLADFIDDVNGRAGDFNTEMNLDSTKTALVLESKAQIGEKR